MTLKRSAAIVVTIVLGATVGLVAGYLTSGYVGMSAGFYYWIRYPIDSWHWPILGALVGGLISFALHLWLPERHDSKANENA
jgi:MFS family permease